MEFVGSVVSALEDPIEPTFARSFVGDTAAEHVAAELVDQLASELMKVPARVWKEMFAGLLAHDDLDEIETSPLSGTFRYAPNGWDTVVTEPRLTVTHLSWHRAECLLARTFVLSAGDRECPRRNPEVLSSEDRLRTS